MPNPFLYKKQFYFKQFSLSKTFLFQTIQFHMSIVLFTQLNVKTVLFQAIQFSISMQFSSI